MGLDITAYKGLKKDPAPERDSDGYPVKYDERFWASKAVIEWTQKEFPGRCDGIEPDVVYTFDDSFGFRAGAYSGYNAWRDWLARISGWGSAERCWESSKTSGPFYELINFADNEGVIGPKVAAKLAKDFADHEAKATEMAADNAYYLQKYQEWRKAFEMAADNGAVDFH